jgi:DNA primase catalytic core
VRQDDAVATSAPPAAAAPEGPAAHVPPALETPLNLATEAPYSNATEYAAAHEALLRELAQRAQWLERAPAAQQAAADLRGAGTLVPSGLTVLLALQAALPPRTNDGNQRTRLAQQLDHHLHRAQLTMAKRVLGQAERSTDISRLRELHEIAFHGQFIAFVQQTADGEMELGQYLEHRSQQVTQQPLDTQDPTEQPSETAEEATTMAVDPDDDIQLPVFELPPGEIIMVAQEAAPRLLAHAQTHLAGGNPEISPFAHIHGRPVYSLVNQADPSAPVLMLGLDDVNRGGSPRAVTISRGELATVTPQTLLNAVTAWMNASDAGGRPLLDYAPSAPAPIPAPAAADRQQSTLTAATPANGPHRTQESAEFTEPAAPATSAPEPNGQPASNAEATPPPDSVVPDAGAAEEAAETPTSTVPSADADSAVVHNADQQQDRAPQEESTAEHLTKQATPAQADPVDRLTALVRSSLTDLGVDLEATGALAADRTVVITLETSGDVDRDRAIANRLRPAVHQAIRQHPDKALAAYRIAFQHTPHVGQGTLQETPGALGAAVPRERLIAANNAAAKVFAERLRSDPNAELARTYLTQERHVPTEVQQEWGLGYAPSDRSAKPKRWDILCQELTAQGFTADVLLQAGLATRSSRGTLIDYFDDRIMFPIHDERGDIVGFSGRRIDRPGETEEQAKKRQSQKYFNTSNDAALFSKGDLVFGLHHPAQAEALAASSGPRVSVEGYLDVIAVARAAATMPVEQRPVAGAPMGTAISERQLAVLRGLDTDNPRPHIAFLDNDSEGRKVLLKAWDLLVRAAGPTAVTSAADVKDAAKLWEVGVKADGDGAGPVLRALEPAQPLLDATVEAVLVKNADEAERANHAFDRRMVERIRFMAAEASRYIHESVKLHSRGDTTAMEAAALTWAKRLDQEWNIPGHLTATAVLLGPGNHSTDYQNQCHEHAVELLAADPEGYFANESDGHSRSSGGQDTPTDSAVPESATSVTTNVRPPAPGQWPAGTRASEAMATRPASEPESAPENLALSMLLPSPVDGQLTEHTNRTSAAYALHAAVHERLGQHTAETLEPDRLPPPRKLGTVHGVDLSTSGDDPTGDDPTVVVWLGSTRSDSLRLSYSRFVEMTGPELLAAVEWRAARAAGLFGVPLSQSWRNVVRSILPPEFPARPTPAQLADLLDTIAQASDGSDERIRHRAEQAVDLYTAGHPDLALDHLAPDNHIWVLRNDGSWIQEEATRTELSWEELDRGFRQLSAELGNIPQAAAELSPGAAVPLPADLTVAHHSAHEAISVMRPHSIGLPGTMYEQITQLVAHMDAAEPALRRLRGPGGKRLMNRAKTVFVRVLEGLSTAASKIRLTALSTRLERVVARLRGQDPAGPLAPRAVRIDRGMQDLAHIERDLERRMATPIVTTPVDERVAARLAEEADPDPQREQQIWAEEHGRELEERGKLQEQWIVNRARWRARYEQLHGLPPDTEFLPDSGLIAGAPPIPNMVAAHERLIDRLTARVGELRDTDQHTGEQSNPDDPTADLLNGVAWAYQQRLIGTVPSGDDPEGPIPIAQLRQAALTVTSHKNASPLTLRRTLHVTPERADRLLHRLEEQQILGPYRADAPRTVLARPADIDALLARPAAPSGLRTPSGVPSPAATSPSPIPREGASEAVDQGVLDPARINEMVSKYFADHQKRNETRDGAGTSDRASAPGPCRKTAHEEAEANALATGQPTSLAPSQS